MFIVLVSTSMLISMVDSKKKSTDNENNSNKKYEGDFEFIDEVSVKCTFMLTMLQLMMIIIILVVIKNKMLKNKSILSIYRKE
jgi:hypothetical protein